MAGSPDDEALVFPTARGTLWTDYDYRNWRKRVYKPAAEAVRLAGSRPYDLRHSFASLLIHEGATVPELARQMGNAPSVTLDTYAHVLEERDPSSRLDPSGAIETARAEFDVRAEYADDVCGEPAERRCPASREKALSRTRTADPLLTIETRCPDLGCVASYRVVPRAQPVDPDSC